MVLRGASERQGDEQNGKVPIGRCIMIMDREYEYELENIVYLTHCIASNRCIRCVISEQHRHYLLPSHACRPITPPFATHTRTSS